MAVLYLSSEKVKKLKMNELFYICFGYGDFTSGPKNGSLLEKFSNVLPAVPISLSNQFPSLRKSENAEFLQ